MDEWEKMNADDPFEERYKSASICLDDAYEHMCEALDNIAEALREVDGTDASERVEELLDDLNDLEIDVNILRKKLKKGVFE